MTQGAASRSRRSAARMVRVAICRTAPWRGGARPWRSGRGCASCWFWPKLVLAQVSSMNRRRAGSTAAWRAFQRSCRKATSGRSCPDARRPYGMVCPSRPLLGSPEGKQGEGLEMRVSVLGVDLGKNVCGVAGLDGSGAVVLRRRAKREILIALAVRLAPCVVGMEACWAPDRIRTCGLCRRRAAARSGRCLREIVNLMSRQRRKDWHSVRKGACVWIFRRREGAARQTLSPGDRADPGLASVRGLDWLVH
jgi:hypothetical protein